MITPELVAALASRPKNAIPDGVESFGAMEMASRSIQPEHASLFPARRFADNGILQASTTANAIERAFYAAQQAGGGTVLLPAGVYAMNRGLDLYGAGYTNGVTIHGVGTTLSWPIGFDQEMIRLRGSPPAPGVFGRGGLKGLQLACANTDPTNTCKGVVIDACVRTVFEDINIYNITGGSSWYCRPFVTDGNSQYVTLRNCFASGGNINFDFQALTDSVGINVGSQSGVTRDFLIDNGCLIAFYSGFIQSTAPVMFEMAGVGGSFVALSDFYHEGGTGTQTMFGLSTPTQSSNGFDLMRFTLRAPIARLIDAGSGTDVGVQTVYGSANATSIIRATGTLGRLRMHDCGSPVTSPAKFSLASGTVANAFIHDAGSLWIAGRTI